MEQKKDIFDRLMELPVLCRFQSLYEKNKEILLYLFFGGLAFLVSISTFWLFHMVLHRNELWANAASWLITVLFAFFTNRIWVFAAPTETVREFLVQLWKFFGGRVVTLVVEEGILLVFITWLGMNSMMVKIFAQVIVIVLNYVISKLVIFKEV